LTSEGRQENSRLHYGGPYDTSKAVAELLVRSHHQSYWAEIHAVAITRCANVIGYGDVNPRRVIPDFIRSALRDKRICIKSPHTARQFIHVTDSTAGYIRAASAIDEETHTRNSGQPPQGCDPFTPTSHFAIEEYPGTRERYITVGHLAEQVAQLFDATVDRSGAGGLAPNENKAQALNCDRTRRTLQWQIRKPLTAALREMGDYYKAESDHARLEALTQRDLTAIDEALQIPFQNAAAEPVELAGVGN
jgi:nucleoside-diphosphate-sugar epimerase